MTVALLITLQGCAWDTHTDVSREPDYWGGYTRDTVYSLHMDLFVRKYRGTLQLVPTGSVNLGSRRFDTPPSIEAYRNGQTRSRADEQLDDLSERNRWGGWLSFGLKTLNLVPKIVGVAYQDTRVRITDVERTDAWNVMFGSTSGLTVYGEILDGEFAGERVDLGLVSDLAPGGRVNGVFVHAPYCVIFKEACSWYMPQ